jgi:aconitase A
MVDSFGSADAFAENVTENFSATIERYAFSALGPKRL